MICACTGGNDPVRIEHTVDACAPLALVTAAPTALQHAGIEGAYALWRERGAPALGRRSGTTMEIRFEDAAAAFHGLYDDHEGVIYINRSIEIERALSVVIAHELGHAFGLPHVPASERQSVMNSGNLSTVPTAADQAEIEALWGACAE